MANNKINSEADARLQLFGAFPSITIILKKIPVAA
jgi:hypothetical protein